MLTPFSITRLPRIEFGRGSCEKLPTLVRQFGQRVLLVSGAKSLQGSTLWPALQGALTAQQIECMHCTVSGEPSPQLIDDYVKEFADSGIQAVVGIGGGSVLDAAKAIAGLLQVRRSVMDYLEGVGPEHPYQGPATPFIAVPTTAGTGSEATKNAVLSVCGKDGFKKSFRHDMLVAEYAVVDPQWLVSCPAGLIAANGMDALTQLLESYVSTRANVMTDTLNLDGLRALRGSLLSWYRHGAEAEQAMDNMAYAAMISGITLAQTGLGSVHGLAAPLGAFYPISHGVACGTLVAEATEVNIQTLRAREPKHPALGRYARLSEILHQRHFDSHEAAWTALVTLLRDWAEAMHLPRLSKFGVKAEALDHVVAHSRGSSMQTNPIELTDAEIKTVLQRRL